MKTNLLYLILLSSLPMLLHAQVEDDLYFLPAKKKNVEKKVEKSFHFEALDNDTVFIDAALDSRFASDDEIDAYNRRYSSVSDDYIDYGDANDTLYITDDDVAPVASGGMAYVDDESDYTCSMRIMRFHSPSVGIYVSSPYYWDVFYSPGGIYYDGWYDWYWASPYYDPWWRYSSWYYHRPAYWGWGGSWYPHHHYAGAWHHRPSRPLYRPGSGRPVGGMRPSSPYRSSATVSGRGLTRSGSRSDSGLRPSVRSSSGRNQQTTTSRSSRSNRSSNTVRNSSNSTRNSSNSTWMRNSDNSRSVRQSSPSRSTIRQSSPTMRPSSPARGGGSGGGRSGGGRR